MGGMIDAETFQDLSPTMNARRVRRRSTLVAALATLSLLAACGGTTASGPDGTDEPAVIPAALKVLRDVHAGMPGAPDGVMTLVAGKQEATVDGKTWTATLRDVHVAGALGGEEPGAAGIVDVKPGDGTTQSYILATDKSGGVRRAAVFPLGFDVHIERMAIVERQIGVTFSDAASVPVAKRKSHFRLVAYSMQPVEPPLILVSRSDGPYKTTKVTTTKPAWTAVFTTGVEESGQIGYQQSIVHRFTAQQSANASFDVTSDDSDVYLTLTAPDGTVLADAAKWTTSWSGELPAAGEYALTISTTNGAGTAYALKAKG